MITQIVYRFQITDECYHLESLVTKSSFEFEGLVGYNMIRPV